MKKLFLVPTVLSFAAIALAGQADARGCVAAWGPPLVVPMEYTGGTAMTAKTATRAGRATNGVAKMGSAMGMIDTERDRRQAALLLAAPEG